MAHYRRLATTVLLMASGGLIGDILYRMGVTGLAVHPAICK